MLFLRRFIPYLLAIIIIILFEILYVWPQFIILGLLLLTLTLYGALWLMMGKGLKTPMSIICFLVPLLLMNASSFSFILFLSKGATPHLIAILSAALSAFYCLNLMRYIWIHDQYLPFSLESISSYLNLLSILFISSSLFAIKIFLTTPLFYLTIFMALTAILVAWHTVWINKFLFRETWHIIAVITLLMTEFFITFTFLPFSFLVLGTLQIIVGYELLELSRAYLLKTFTPQTANRVLAVGGILVVFIFLVTRWKL